MADRYDPRLSVRPASERRFSDQAAPAKAGNDPLAELARMVSGRSTDRGLPPQRSRATPLSRQPAPAPTANAGVASDLESELINDLQASFVAVKPFPMSRAAAAPAPAPLAQSVAEAAEEIAEVAEEDVIEAPTPLAEAPMRDRLADALAALAPVAAPEPTPAPPRVTAPRPAPGAAANQAAVAPVQSAPILSTAAANRLRDALNALGPAPLAPRAPSEETFVEPAEPTRERAATSAALRGTAPAERAARATQVAERMDLPNLQLRPQQPLQDVRQRPHPRWEKPQEPVRPSTGSAASRFAPPKATTATARALDPVEEPVSFPVDQAFEDEAPLPALADADEFADDLALPREFVEEDPDEETDFGEYAPTRSHRRRTLAIFVALLLVVAAGGAYLMLRGGGATGLPRLITADGGPSKVAPAAIAASPDADQSKLIYDRVGGGGGNGATTIITPPTTISPVPSSSSRGAIAQVINAPAAIDPTATGGTKADAAPQPNEPRKVRTVVVRPDGTVLSSDATDAAASAPPQQVATANPPATVPPPSPAAAAANRSAATAAPIGPPSVVATPAPKPSNNETLNVAGAGAGNAAANGALAITPNAPPGGTAASATGTAAPAKPAAAPATVSSAAAPAAPVPTATAKPTPAPAAPAPAAATATAATQVATATLGASAVSQPQASVSGGIMVQVSSQKTEDGARATFKDLQAHYPKVLSNYPVDIQKADLGDKGVFYRARIGPFAQADAQKLCDDLKSAGGDCLLTR